MMPDKKSSHQKTSGHRDSPDPMPASRRAFLTSSSSMVAGAALCNVAIPNVHVDSDDTIRVAVIGCGGRGGGAADNLLSTQANVQLVSVADAFLDRAQYTLEGLREKHADKADVSEDNVFIGLDAYKKAIDSDCDLVVLATPPGFRPLHFEYAVKQGKHVFCEKPVATHAPGVRRFLASVEQAKKKNLMVGIGLQRRHEQRYIETIARIHDGAIGDVIAMQVYWNGPGIWYRDRDEGQSEMSFQTKNWYHFNWLSGDQICEQHIHNLDVGCWVKGAYPVECNGMGGREMREDGDPRCSQIFDHTSCEFTFADGSKMFSQGRHLKGGWQRVGEWVMGSKGNADPSGVIHSDRTWKYQPPAAAVADIKKRGKKKRRKAAVFAARGHQQEQNDLIAALLRGDVYNEGEYGAHSTFTGILGREACYSGQRLKWNELLAKGKDHCPGIDHYGLDTEPPTKPDVNGNYPVPVPGKYDPFA